MLTALFYIIFGIVTGFFIGYIFKNKRMAEELYHYKTNYYRELNINRTRQKWEPLT